MTPKLITPWGCDCPCACACVQVLHEEAREAARKFEWSPAAYDAAWQGVLGDTKLAPVRDRLSVNELQVLIMAALNAAEPNVRAHIASTAVLPGIGTP